MPDFTEEQIAAAWELAEPFEGQDPAQHRVVWPSGAVISRDKFHMRGKLGWTIQDGRPVPFTNMSLAQVSALLKRQRRARYEQRREKAGHVKVTVWVPVSRVKEVQKLAARWCEES